MGSQLSFDRARCGSLVGLLLASAAVTTPAAAQETATSAATVDTGEIIVTARKRAESDLAVPVAISTVSGAEIARRGVNNLESLTQSVPSLQLAPDGGSIQGAVIVIRGVGAGADNPFADQAVSFNIDGAQVARSSVQRMAQMDIQQVEVLKGPQALFFGKNSPAGIISIRTADPTDHFEAKLSAGYEFNAEEVRTEGYVSGPVTETLGVRVAGYASHMRGWLTNDAPDVPGFAPARRHLPHDREWAGRITLKFDPSDSFDARFKLTHNELKGSGQGPTGQLIYCASGVSALGGPDDCRANSRLTRMSLGTAFSDTQPAFGDGEPFSRQKQTLGSLEMNYKPVDGLTLTSVTSYYLSSFRGDDNFTKFSDPSLILTSYNTLRLRETSQELRLASDFDSPFNFTIGGYYQDSALRNGTFSALNGVTPFFINRFIARQEGESYSGFAELQWKIVPTVELTAGGRYSHEKKSVSFVSAGVPQATARPEDSWNNFSPEVSLTWRPDNDLTVFGSYRRGFLSGGFNAGGGIAFANDLSYDQQTIRGFEGGVKAYLLDRALRLDLVGYTYKVRGLQVTSTDNDTISQTTTNAGRSSTKGIEASATWTTPLQGLTLRGSGAYNRARYQVFALQCYIGQTLAEGCDQALVGGVGTKQDLAGHQIVRSPEWTGNAEVSYEAPLGGGLKLGLSGNASYSSSYYTNAVEAPHTRQGRFWLLDGSVRLAQEDDRWELALVGRNLTNKYYHSTSYEQFFVGGGTGTAGPSTPADVFASVSRGRQIMVRAAVKFD